MKLQKIGWNVLVTSWLVIAPCGSVQAASGPYDEGLDQYNMKRYNAASSCFQKAAEAGDHTQRAYYYLGLCLCQLGDYQGAHDAFSTAYHLNPFSDDGHAAKKAMLSATDDIESAKHPTDDPRVYQQAVSEINRQVADSSRRWIIYGQQMANQTNAAGTVPWGRGTVYNGWGNNHGGWGAYANGNYGYGLNAMPGVGLWPGGAQAGYSPVYTGREINQFAVQSFNQSSALQHQAWGYRGAAETQIAGNNLKSLLSEPPGTGVPHLRALGTNLFVRNYSQFDGATPPADPPLELKATELSLRSLPVELHAIEQSLPETKALLQNKR